jgi:hypothetical protein
MKCKAKDCEKQSLPDKQGYCARCYAQRRQYRHIEVDIMREVELGQRYMRLMAKAKR